MKCIKKIFAVTVWTSCVLTSFAQSSQNRTSDALSVGLPVFAAVASLAKDDTQGLYQLMQSEAAALVATQVLKSAIHETVRRGSIPLSNPLAQVPTRGGHCVLAPNFATVGAMNRGGGCTKWGL